MKKIFGYVSVVVGVILVALFFLAPRTSQERAILDRQAEYGGVGALTENPRKIFLLGGVALLAIGGGLIKS